jgi:predicted transcriptional regulator
VTRTVEIQIQVPETASDESLRLAEEKAKETFILVLQQQGEFTLRDAASALGLTYEGYLELLAQQGLPATTDETDPAALDTLRQKIRCTRVARAMPVVDPAGTIGHGHRREERHRMSRVKDEVRKILDQLPDDVSFEDIQYHIYVRQKLERGLKDVQEGRVVSQEEMERRMARWLDE